MHQPAHTPPPLERDDWTGGPAKWFAVGVLSTLAALALGWAAVRTWGERATPSAAASTPTRFVHAAEVGRSLDQPAPKGPSTAQGASTAAVEIPPASEAAPASAAPAVQAAPAPAAKSPAATLDRRININTASKAELETLPRIGPAMADRIIEERTLRGPFARVEDLNRVRGIGPKTIDRLRPHISVRDDAPGGTTDPDAGSSSGSGSSSGAGATLP